jgi:hypothetical protein
VNPHCLNTPHPSIFVSPLFWFAPWIHNTLLHLQNPISQSPSRPSNPPFSVLLPALEKFCIPDQDLSQITRLLLINPLLGIRKLNVHITIDANQTALVLGLTPLQADYDFFVDSNFGVSFSFFLTRLYRLLVGLGCVLR